MAANSLQPDHNADDDGKFGLQLEAWAARRRVSVLLFPEASRAGAALSNFLSTKYEIPPWRIEAPIETGALLQGWCGVGSQPEKAVAEMLLTRARSNLPLDDRTESTVERWWRLNSADGLVNHAHGPDAPFGAIEFSRAILTASANSAIEAIRQGLIRLKARGLSEVEQFQMAAQVWGEGQRPIMLVIGPDQAEVWVETLRAMVAAAEWAREARLIVVIDAETWGRLEKRLDSHVQAILHKGVMAIEENGPSSAVQSLDTLRDQTRRVVAQALAVRPASASASISPAAPAPVEGAAELPPEQALARSLAEALLYAALQNHPPTSGLFQLNADGGFVFGNRPAEIDLACSSLLIAIEVDGYFHFQDKQAYRRDRAKDWLMQRAGMVVLRFLAEDVVERLDFIMELVTEVVELRRLQKEASK